MTNGIGTVEVKRSRGEMVLLGLGKTPRGTNFVRQKKGLGVKRSSDPAFKSHLQTAVAEMLAQEALPV